MPKLGILISGRGSNMDAIVRSIQQGRLLAEVSVVISHSTQADGLSLAQSYGIDTRVFEPSNYENKDHYEQAIVQCLQSYQVDLVVLAGYMKLVGDPMLHTFNGRMINIHPSLLPSFKGLNAQKQALDYGVKVTGCTVHYVTKEMDARPIISQHAVPVLDDDTVDSLSARILSKEHILLPSAISLILNEY